MPFDKFPFLEWINAEYAYTANYRWQRGSQQFEVLEDIPDLGNFIENGNTHAINGQLDMETLYKYVGLVKKKKGRAAAKGKDERGKGVPSPEDEGDKSQDRRAQALGANGADQNAGGTTKGLSGGDKALNTGIGLLTAIKKSAVQLSGR